MNGSGIVPTPQASVAQLDRASVFGTEAQNTQTQENQSLRNSPQTHTPKNTPVDSELLPTLQQITDHWDALPEHIKATIATLIQPFSRKDR